MKELVKVILLTSVLMSLVSCESLLDIFEKQNFILAGDQEGDGVKYTCCIDSVLSCEDYFSHDISMKYHLGIKSSSNPEITIFASSAGGLGGYNRYLGITSNSDSCNISLLEGNPRHIQIHHFGDTINSDLNWSALNGSYYLIEVSSEYDFHAEEYIHTVQGAWKEVYDAYVGVRLINKRDTSYSWIRLDVFENSKIHIWDLAYVN